MIGSNDYAQSRSLYGDSNVLEKTQRDRNYFSRLWQENPEHAYGLGANDYLNTVIANSGGQAQFQQGILDASAAAQNQAAAASGANIAALGSIAGNIGKAASGLPAISGSGGGNYLDSGYYAGDTNTSPGVTGGSDFYTGDPSEVSTFDSSGGGL